MEILPKDTVIIEGYGDETFKVSAVTPLGAKGPIVHAKSNKTGFPVMVSKRRCAKVKG